MTEFAWSWDDYVQLTGKQTPAKGVRRMWERPEKGTRRQQSKKDWRKFHGGNTRPYGRLSRFRGAGLHAVASRAAVALRADHPALLEARTIFPRSVKEPAERVLVSGFNNAKTGDRVLKGPWRGCKIYTLTLEERASCPPCCGLWRECYGNAMPFARRHAHGESLEGRLWHQVPALLSLHRIGIAVRLHVLGDFYSPSYARLWCHLLAACNRLHVWGYTAHPEDGEIGGILAWMNELFPDRCRIRFTVEPGSPLGPLQATTCWERPHASVIADGQVCPAQLGATECCGTCALCWARPMLGRRIVFLGHGMAKTGRRGRGQGRLL